MKVLWFVNKPLPAVSRRLGLPDRHLGGWLDGLEEALRDCVHIELAVASAAQRLYEPFEEDGVVYYGVGTGEPELGIGRMAKRWRGVIPHNDDSSEYRAVVEAFGPDIVHVHGTEDAFGLVCDQIRVPSVISIQGLLSIIEKMSLRGVDSSFVRSLSPSLFLRGTGFVHASLALKRAAERERRIISRATNILGRTRFDEDVVRAMNPACRYFPSDDRILRPVFYSARWTVNAGREPIIYCTAGRYALKGVGTLLEAVAILKRRAVPNVRLRIAGSLGSPEEDEHAARRRIRKLRLEENVVLLGVIGPCEVAKELCGARAFAISSHAENESNALLEAMLIGVPCVATSVGGIPSMARDGLEVLLVQDGDPYALAGALLRVLEDDGLAARLGSCARETAMARHEPGRIVERLLGVYRDVASGG